MKLIRYVDIVELQQLYKQGKVVPKRKYLEFNNEPTNIKLHLNIKRSEIDIEDKFVTYKGYTLNDITQIEINDTLYTIEQVRTLINNNITATNSIQTVSAGSNCTNNRR